MTVFITSSGDDPELLAARVQLLAPFPVVVHLDRQQPSSIWLKALAASSGHVHWVSSRVRESTYGLSAARVQFLLMERAIRLAAPGEYVVALRADDVIVANPHDLAPLWAGVEQIRYVRAAEHRHVVGADIELWQRYDPPLTHRLEAWHQLTVRAAARALPAKLVRRPLPDHSPVAHGERSWALTREAVDHCLAARNARTDAWFARTRSPAHMYVHTLIATSAFHRRTVDGGYSAIDCGHDCLIPSIHWSVPFNEEHVLTESDLERIDQSTRPFARGVRLPASAGLFQELRTRRGLTR